jgi:hypothetical protein
LRLRLPLSPSAIGYDWIVPEAATSNPKRPPWRMLVTLIAAVRCSDGIALAADSQETVEHYRRTVQKLSPLDLGGISTVLAGAGNADLIDSVIVKIKRRFASRQIRNLAEFAEEMEAELGDFYASDVALCPDRDKSLRLFVAASSPHTNEYAIWNSRNTTLVPIGLYDLAGWEEALYDVTLRRLCSTGMTLQQGVLAALYGIMIAEETSNYVRSPIQVATIKSSGVWIEDPKYVELMVQRLRDYEVGVSSVFLACADIQTRISKGT